MSESGNDTDLGLIRAAANGLDPTSVVAAGLNRARRLIADADTYIYAQSPFDRHARIGIPHGGVEVGQDLFLSFLGTQVMAWTAFELDQLREIVASLQKVFARIPMKLPQKVYLLKSTGREEGAAAYTRHLDTIVLPVNMVSSLLAVPAGGDPLHPGRSSAYLAGIITHEFFHILSKNNPAWRKELYGILGFRPLPNSVVLPDDKLPSGLSMRDMKITNPDAPLLNVAIDLMPTGSSQPVPMTPALVSSGPYVGGEFFDTLQWIFLEVEEEKGNWQVRRRDDKAVWHQSDDLMSQYLDKVGRNLSGELFHPDEVLAQSFVMAAHEPSLALLERISEMIWPARRNG